MILDPMRADGAPDVRFQHSRRVQRTRRPHVCFECGQTIAVGSAAYVVVCMTTDDTAPWSQYAHDGKADRDECNERTQGRF